MGLTDYLEKNFPGAVVEVRRGPRQCTQRRRLEGADETRILQAARHNGKAADRCPWLGLVHALTHVQIMEAVIGVLGTTVATDAPTLTLEEQVSAVKLTGRLGRSGHLWRSNVLRIQKTVQVVER